MIAILAAAPFVPLAAGFAAAAAFVWFARHRPEHRPKT